jgi:tripartite-type tricarboxylate transporter receptor subunit TctC
MVRAALLAGLVAAAFAGAASAQDFYRGKTISIVVGNTAGGGFDANARLLARHIGRHIAGSPAIIVVNMPGAAGLTSMHNIENQAPKDGTVLNHFNFGLILDSKLRPERVRLDFSNYAWIGSIGSDVSVCYVWYKIPERGLEALRRRGTLNFGETAAGSSNDINTRIAKSVFGLDIRQISGYPGSTEQRLAIERGELDGSCGAWGSLPAEWLDGHKVAPFLKALPVLQPGLPADVPYAADIAPSPRDRALIRLLTESGEVGRPFIASSAVPPERLRILRDGFDATMSDPAFLAEAAKLRLPVSPKTAAEAERIVAEIFAAPDDIVDAARKLISD